MCAVLERPPRILLCYTSTFLCKSLSLSSCQWSAPNHLQFDTAQIKLLFKKLLMFNTLQFIFNSSLLANSAYESNRLSRLEWLSRLE